jgi:hypothetical protein
MNLYRSVEPFFSDAISKTKTGEGHTNALLHVSEHLLQGVLNKDDTIVLVCGYFPELPVLSNSVRIAKAGMLA